MKLQILHTNDLHSHFEKLPYIKSCIKKNRMKNALVLDGGDFHDMKSLTLIGSNAKAGALFLKECGYDAMTLGNNDLWSGEGNFENIIENELVDVLACNIEYYPKRAIPLKRSMVRIFEGVKICVIGVSVGSDSYNAFSHLYGLHVQEALLCIQKEMNDNPADIYILLSHMGYSADKEIAEKLPVDIIIGGHSHTLMEKAELVDGTYLHQAGQYGEHVGELRIEIENKKIISVESLMHDSGHYEADKACLRLVESEKQKALERLNQPFVQLPFDLRHEWIEEDELCNFTADASLKIMPADLAVVNSGLFLHGLKKNVSKADIFDAAPSPLNVSRAYLKGEKILEAIRLSFEAEHCLHEVKAPGFRGKKVGHLAVSENVRVIRNQDEICVLINGKKLERNRKYLVCANDFLFRGSGYPSFFSEDHLEFDKRMMKDLLVECLDDAKLVEKSKIKRFMTIYS